MNLFSLLPAIAWVLFGGVFVFVSIISAVLNYHWGKYGFAGVERVGRVRLVYFAVAVLLFAGALITGLL